MKSTNYNFEINGLSDDEVLLSRQRHGRNMIAYGRENALTALIKKLAGEPMVVLLLVAAAIYLISGKTGDGIFLICATILVAAISLFQDSRSQKALVKLKAFTAPGTKVIRNGKTVEVSTEELVVGDAMVLEEGGSIGADGIILHSHDFSVNESLLTGESFAISKDSSSEDHLVYTGSNVISGLAIAEVSAIGNGTKLGKIGKSLEDIEEESTPLEVQIFGFVKKMVVGGAIVFLIVWAINYYNAGNVLESLLKALTLAMSILPEEIPVAFSTFMALGAWRLMKMGIIVKQTKTVETLGSADVFCVDKTGTITENRMELAKIYLLSRDEIIPVDSKMIEEEEGLIRTSMWASEPMPFDPMEVSIHQVYSELMEKDERMDFRLIHEYPLSGKPPMMTHVFQKEDGERIIAAKGAAEAIIQTCNLNEDEILKIHLAIHLLSSEGFRVLGVGEAGFEGDQFLEHQQQYSFQFKGLLAFHDPPKQNISEVFHALYAAGMAVKIITGDNSATTTTIAGKIGFKNGNISITGEELMAMNETEFQTTIQKVNIFTRMFPEAKLKIINGLKAAGKIVAMTGDGVNDGPALKAANIGIAMGKKGTEIAKGAASLVLINDDLSALVDAIAMGRRIYANLKKAIQYIISIHIPIILTVFLPLALGWVYPNIFSPVHIIFLELIMGPTCSIIYENEPMEKNTMLLPPRPVGVSFFNFRELSTSIIQGLAITAGTLYIYQHSVHSGYDEALTRTMTFTVLIVANVFLTLVNRSFYFSIITTLRYQNNLIPVIIGITILMLGWLVTVQPLTDFFEFSPLSSRQLLICTGIGFISVIWFEAIKFFNKLLLNHV